MAWHRTRGRSNERGASLIEAALATPLFLLLIFTVFELGLLAFSDLTTTNASRAGARSAGVFDARRNADFEILATVGEKLGDFGLLKLDYVVVYRIDQVGDDMNPLCHSQSVSSAADPVRPCNRYVPADLNRPYYLADGVTESTDFGCGVGAVDRFWCPADRNTSLSGALDLVGVYVRTDHHYITGVIGQTQDLSGSTVSQVEPVES
ncbi:MAG: TadE family protein [Acidimicrobiales bacterium]